MLSAIKKCRKFKNWLLNLGSKSLYIYRNYLHCNQDLNVPSKTHKQKGAEEFSLASTEKQRKGSMKNECNFNFLIVGTPSGCICYLLFRLQHNKNLLMVPPRSSFLIRLRNFGSSILDPLIASILPIVFNIIFVYLVFKWEIHSSNYLLPHVKFVPWIWLNETDSQSNWEVNLCRSLFSSWYYFFVSFPETTCLQANSKQQSLDI